MQDLHSVEYEMRREIEEYVRDARDIATLLSCGVNLSDYSRFQKVPLELIFRGACLRGDVTEGDARWCLPFVSETIVKWQTMGLRPRVLDRDVDGCDATLKNARGTPG